jgi:hypothetical protein
VLDEDKYFNEDFLGQLKVPVSLVFDSENKSFGLAWYLLLPKNKDCGFFFFLANWELKFSLCSCM